MRAEVITAGFVEKKKINSGIDYSANDKIRNYPLPQRPFAIFTFLSCHKLIMALQAFNVNLGPLRDASLI